MPESESKIPKELLEKAAHLGARRQRVNEIVADLYIGAREGGKAKDLLEPATEAILKELDEALASEREKILRVIAEVESLYPPDVFKRTTKEELEKAHEVLPENGVSHLHVDGIDHAITLIRDRIDSLPSLDKGE